MAALLIKTSIPPISRTTPSTRLRAELASATSRPKELVRPPVQGEKRLSRRPVGAVVDGDSCAFARELSCNLASDAVRGARH